jgi:hypothetical protein
MSGLKRDGGTPGATPKETKRARLAAEAAAGGGGPERETFDAPKDKEKFMSFLSFYLRKLRKTKQVRGRGGVVGYQS